MRTSQPTSTTQPGTVVAHPWSCCCPTPGTSNLASAGGPPLGAGEEGQALLAPPPSMAAGVRSMLHAHLPAAPCVAAEPPITLPPAGRSAISRGAFHRLEPSPERWNGPVCPRFVSAP